MTKTQWNKKYVGGKHYNVQYMGADHWPYCAKSKDKVKEGKVLSLNRRWKKTGSPPRPRFGPGRGSSPFVRCSRTRTGWKQSALVRFVIPKTCSRLTLGGHAYSKLNVKKPCKPLTRDICLILNFPWAAENEIPRRRIFLERDIAVSVAKLTFGFANQIVR